MKKKRNLFEELVLGIDEIIQNLEGKITLKTYRAESTAKPKITPAGGVKWFV
jgi:hypothetical protein